MDGESILASCADNNEFNNKLKRINFLTNTKI